MNLTLSAISSIMITFALLVFLALPNGHIWAKVVDDFNECRQFFYLETEPHGMDQNAKKICQKYGEESGGHSGFYYATLYSTFHRIPLYSAYIFDPSCKNEGGQKSEWFIEPMVRCPSFFMRECLGSVLNRACDMPDMNGKPFPFFLIY